MEIIDRESERDDDLVQIAFADTREEAALIRGLLRDEGIRSRIYVRPTDAAPARKLLGETMVEDPFEDEVPEPANAGYLADAAGRRPRDYSLLGAYTRAWVIGIAALAVILIVFLLLH